MGISLGTVFSGIGAIEWALKRMHIPFEIKFACDIDKYAKKSFIHNYQLPENNWFDDVNDINGIKFKNSIDLFVGGSPCQPFSIVGNRNGLNDIRGTLFYEFVRLVDEIKPKVFIYENVQGILTLEKGKTWNLMKEVFDSLGYKIHISVLNSKDFNIPQHRKRIFVVGTLDKEKLFYFPKKEILKWEMKDFLQDSLKLSQSKFPRSKRDFERIKIFRQNQFPIDDKYFDKFIISEKVKKVILSTGTKNFYCKPKLDSVIAKPLLATMHKMHRAGIDNYMTCRDNQIRKLTPREALRLMGFDDSFEIVVSNTQIYRQAGNSIVVDVLIKLIESLIESNLIEA